MELRVPVNALDVEARITLERLTLDLSFHAEPGRTTVVVGPNGAGKTTLLRAIAGLIPVDDGMIVLDGSPLDDPRARAFVPAEERSVGYVFQRDALLPHLSATANVAFGLRARGMPRRRATSEARAALERFGLGYVADARPARLSGGQRQVVALARAVVTQPKVLLLDEPLSAIDAAARPALRRRLREVAVGDAAVRIIVTHDPTEALALADTIAVMEAGRIVQTGTPEGIAQRPRSRYVAELVGVNLLRGRASGDGVVLADGSLLATADPPPPGIVMAVVRPTAVALHRRQPEGSPRNVWMTSVEDVETAGSRVRVRLRAPAGLVAEVTPGAVADLGLAPGVDVYATVKATEVAVFEG